MYIKMEFINNQTDGQNNDLKIDVINENSVSIYRYKFTDDFTKELYAFSKIHQYDHRKDFKDAWNIWIEENEEIIAKESDVIPQSYLRLFELGQDGNYWEIFP